MLPCRQAALLFILVATTAAAADTVAVDTAAELVAAVCEGKQGDTIEIAPGSYALSAPLEPGSGLTLRGAGIDRTVLTPAPGWEPLTTTLPDPEVTTKGLDSRAYLVRLKDNAAGVTISGLTLRAPRLHGAIFGWQPTGLRLEGLKVQETRWCGVRTFGMKRGTIADCQFVDAGGRWQRGGVPGAKGGITGGGIFAVWTEESEIAHNRFVRTRPAKEHEFYGIKGRQAKRTRIHHNTIEVNFSIEFPFENDEDVAIDHNVLHGTVSIPKHAGGPVPASGRTFHIHHNYFRDSYSIEFVRNGVEVDHNLFDLDRAKDHGNLISAFGKAPAKGPASFHHNLVSDPGRGVIWLNEPYAQLDVHHNHIRARTTATPRQEGLFGFHPECDFATIAIRDNVIECEGQPRPLFRNEASYRATVRNNRLVNVADAARVANEPGRTPPGPEAPLRFACGVHGEVAVGGWDARPRPAR